mmetsp:Transcript_13565/g.15529  ORF Transcript_13565/g.15529 Transcript_13565/m.15529 type:complete len:136 (+) Transcript_13565:42-449(+)
MNTLFKSVTLLLICINAITAIEDPSHYVVTGRVVIADPPQNYDLKSVNELEAFNLAAGRIYGQGSGSGTMALKIPYRFPVSKPSNETINANQTNETVIANSSQAEIAAFEIGKFFRRKPASSATRNHNSTQEQQN